MWPILLLGAVGLLAYSQQRKGPRLIGAQRCEFFIMPGDIVMGSPGTMPVTSDPFQNVRTLRAFGSITSELQLRCNGDIDRFSVAAGSMRFAPAGAASDHLRYWVVVENPGAIAQTSFHLGTSVLNVAGTTAEDAFAGEVWTSMPSRLSGAIYRVVENDVDSAIELAQTHQWDQNGLRRVSV